jgi:hypothetical protein
LVLTWFLLYAWLLASLIRPRYIRNIQHGLVIVNKERVTLAARFDFRREYLDNEGCAGEKALPNREIDLWNRIERRKPG